MKKRKARKTTTKSRVVLIVEDGVRGAVHMYALLPPLEDKERDATPAECTALAIYEACTNARKHGGL